MQKGRKVDREARREGGKEGGGGRRGRKRGKEGRREKGESQGEQRVRGWMGGEIKIRKSNRNQIKNLHIHEKREFSIMFAQCAKFRRLMFVIIFKIYIFILE